MIQFVPAWLTSNSEPLDPTPLDEGTLASFTVVAEDVATVTLPAAVNLSIRLPSASGQITEVTVNQIPLLTTKYSVVGKNLLLDISDVLPGIGVPVTIRIKRNPTYSLLNGSLPPGLRLLANGSITGTVGNVVGTSTKTFQFTVRAENEIKARDRAFVIRVNPTPTATVWRQSTLPYPETDAGLGVDYYEFGDLKRLETRVIPLEAIDADNEPYKVEVRPTGLTGLFFEGLPPGMVLRDNVLRGVIASTAQPGRYLFRLGFVGQAINSIIGEIVVQDATAITTFSPNLIEWITPRDLGVVPETYPCETGVKAHAGQLKLVYDLAPGSGPLPPGLRLNRFTGDLQGSPNHVGGQFTYPFTVRASTGAGTSTIFSDKEFALTVGSRYDTADILDVRLKLRTMDRLGVVERYQSIIPPALLYRRNDRLFGLQEEPYVHLIKGLRGTTLNPAFQGDGNTGPLGNDYHAAFNVLLGRHYGAVARDETGAVIYEVIYRTIIDPQALAGGFRFGTNEAVEEKVLYPQSRQVRQYVFPKSIRNARMDLTRDLGFATSDPKLVRLTDREGVEGLPTWMTCRQDPEDPDSVLGYFPALVIAYVVPGQARQIINTLNADAELPPVGRQVTFERYVIFNRVAGDTISGSTTFDENTTTFDEGTTIFDLI